jgi:hypothetical protein
MAVNSRLPCGPGNPCRGDNECCSGDVNRPDFYGKCGITSGYCFSDAQENLCGPCTHANCFNAYTNTKTPEDIENSAKPQCPIQVAAYNNLHNINPINCVVGPWSLCTKNERMRTIIPATNGGVCNEDETITIQRCYDCIVDPWTACSNGKRTRKIIPATNGGTCTEDETLTIQDCSDCIVDPWTACSNGKRTRTITPATNGGTCTESGIIQDCTDCILSDWSAWSECDCKTKKITRIKKVINNNNLSCKNLIENQNCSNNEKCLKLECESQNKYYNSQTKKCDNDNILNYIINLFNLIILFITNLFK